MTRPPTAPKAGPLERALAGFGALACAVVLAIAAWLAPDSAGAGTHTQLGMAPCPWVWMFDKPCPTCGMTTAFAYAASGSPIGAVRAQPLGAVLAYTTGAAFWLLLHVLLTGSRIHTFALSGAGRRFAWLAIAALIASWLIKIATWPAG